MGPSGFEGVARAEVKRERPEAVRVWLLGGFRIFVGPRTIVGDAWRIKKAASLIKLLALTPGHHLHRERAMDLLWPDLEKRAASNNLRQARHDARRTLASDTSVGAATWHPEMSRLSCVPKGTCGWT
jgi:DNA-binding SARP family transcriptional activator